MRAEVLISRRVRRTLLWLGLLIAVACSSDNDLNPQPELPAVPGGFSQSSGRTNGSIHEAPEASGGESADP